MIVKLILLLSTAAAIEDTQGPCDSRLGCFPKEYPYSDPFQRPIYHEPTSAKAINVSYLLFTRNNRENYQVISAFNVSSLADTNFGPNRKSIFIIHGYTEGGSDPWLVTMCQNFLEVSDVNCFCVDWRGGSTAIYTQAVSNVRVVGAEIVFFLGHMQKKYNYKMYYVYLVGHSLGAQVAGDAGRRQAGIAVIMALDPAGPLFDNTSPILRLDPTDAILVVVIHTDVPSIVLPFGIGIGGFGIKQACGNYDIYPNDGEHMPGCDPISVLWGNGDDIFKGAHEILTCNHHRSYIYFSKAILLPHGFIGYYATSFDDFKKGSGFPCTNDSCVFMWHNIDEHVAKHQQDSTSNKKFYLTTGGLSDLPRWRYNASMTLDGAQRVLGSLLLSLCGKNGCSKQYEIYRGLLHSGATYALLIDVEIEVKPVQHVKCIWKKNFLDLQNAKMGASAVAVQHGPSGETYKFCGGKPTEENTPQTLEQCP